jgi:GH24 family phage-related lysozyme (muramidase)
MNAERQAMTGYMMRRISVMKHDKEEAKEALRRYNRKRAKDKTLEEKPLEAFRTQSDTILFDSVFTAVGNESTSRELNRRNRQFCCQALDYWKAAGYIKGYCQQKKGRSITGVTIEH